jgi:hypothetical protein
MTKTHGIGSTVHEKGAALDGRTAFFFDMAVKKRIKLMRSYAVYEKKFYAKQSNIMFIL